MSFPCKKSVDPFSRNPSASKKCENRLSRIMRHLSKKPFARKQDAILAHVIKKYISAFLILLSVKSFNGPKLHFKITSHNIFFNFRKLQNFY